MWRVGRPFEWPASGTVQRLLVAGWRLQGRLFPPRIHIAVSWSALLWRHLHLFGEMKRRTGCPQSSLCRSSCERLFRWQRLRLPLGRPCEVDQASHLGICEGDDCVLPLGQLGHMLDHVNLVAHRYVLGQPYVVFPCLGRITGGMPPRNSMDFMRRSVIGVARTRVVGQGQSASSIGVLPTSGDQPADSKR